LILAAIQIENPDLIARVERWHYQITHNDYATFVQLRAGFPRVDLVGDRLAFNLGSYRLIVGFNFQTQTLYFKHLLSHDDYMRKGWQSE
jgi:mRNA interferase HigB